MCYNLIMKRYALGMIFIGIILTLGGVAATRWTHNPEIVGSIPTPATNTLNQTKPTPDRGFSVNPKVKANKSVEINLTANTITLKADKDEILPIAYQAKEGKWFQTPTGYFRAGAKNKDHKSSLTGVFMPYAVQLYEDFFIHEIPFFEDGKKLTSAYTGGCIRLETEIAKRFFEFVDTGTPITIFKDFTGLALKEKYHKPVDLSLFWIRQSFNNPIRQTHKYSGNIDKIEFDYYQHAGVDLAPNYNDTEYQVYAIADGKIAGVWQNGSEDHGLGNTIIIDHGEFYALYGHLSRILKLGGEVKRGDTIGFIGNTGYGCDYWRIGEDGCDSKNPEDRHLHLEIKTKPVLENPEGADACEYKTGKGVCYGYVPDNPKNYGYLDPIEVLFDKSYPQ